MQIKVTRPLSLTICGFISLVASLVLLANLVLVRGANARPPYEGELSGPSPCFDANDGIDPRWASDAANKVLWGLINRKGEMVLSPQLETVQATGKYQSYPTIKDNPYFNKDIFDQSGKTCIARGGKGVSVYCEYQGITMVPLCNQQIHKTKNSSFQHSKRTATNEQINKQYIQP